MEVKQPSAFFINELTTPCGGAIMISRNAVRILYNKMFSGTESAVDALRELL